MRYRAGPIFAQVWTNSQLAHDLSPSSIYTNILYLHTKKKKPNISHSAYILLHYYVITVLLFTHYYSKQQSKQKTTVLHALSTCVFTLLILFSKKSLLGIFPRILKKKILTDFSIEPTWMSYLFYVHTHNEKNNLINSPTLDVLQTKKKKKDHMDSLINSFSTYIRRTVGG